MIVIRLILAAFLLIICFVLPLHVYSIGGNQGFGIQGSLYRFQLTGYGPMMITLTKDISYVTSGIYSGRTALSIGLWVAGSLSLVIITLMHLIGPKCYDCHYPQLLGFSLVGAGMLFIVSCIAQFGPFLNGSAGISIPFGGFVLILLGLSLTIYPSLLS